MEELFEQLNAMRRKGTAWLIGGLAAIVGGFIGVNVVGLYCLPLILFGIVGLIIFGRSRSKFCAVYKNEVVRGVLGEVFEDVQFTPEAGITEEVLEATRMVNTADRFSSNDLITGRYHGVEFVQSDVKIEDESTNSDGDTTYSTLFEGRWMIFRFNKEFRCDMQVMSKHFGVGERKGGLFARKEDKMPPVELESAEFNKVFRVYAHDAHDVFYILTPHMMEALLQLKTDCKGQLMLLFVNGDLHVAVDNRRDAFEPPTFRRMSLDDERARILADIKVVTDFVDGMKLDNDIYRADTPIV